MATANTFKQRFLSECRAFINAYEEIKESRENWIALGGADYTAEITDFPDPLDNPNNELTEAQFADALYAVGMLIFFMEGPTASINVNAYRAFFERVAS